MIYNPAQISIWYVGDLYVNKYMNLFRMHTPNKVIKNQLFSHLLLDGISALNGILFVYGLSLFISRFFSKIGKALCFIGKNTMGILFFHFTFFKVMYFPFYLGGLITKADFSCLIPGTMSSPILEEKYWFIIAAGAIALSLTTWRLMMRNQMAVFLLGQSKQRYIDIWNVLIFETSNYHFPGILNTCSMDLQLQTEPFPLRHSPQLHNV